jgi:hypothetical protein
MMEFNNLDCNIMDILGDHWKRSDTSGPFELSCILDAFSDIPKENLMGALLALQKAGSLYLHKGGQTLSLTASGIAQIESLRTCMEQASVPNHHIFLGCCL